MYNHFKLYELFKCCSVQEEQRALADPRLVNNMLDLVTLLNSIRCVVGIMNITSCYRDTTHNKRVGGSATSQHIQFEACDFKSPGTTAHQLFQAIEVMVKKEQISVGQVIEYPTFVHVSLPSKSHKNCFYSNLDGTLKFLHN